ncbi:hypothetical protein CC86DRAFT_422575 [Ophiobolus disseminans]|uniref:Uncharacterized protein n=1 Tax=Ophiobolus disseminans TaxID=1469910 RepID=A0A6A6ZR74_9PLEO|nr:hypothetical protein CC86DRAFT_422575 [Ophiobolus disseminans]
MRHLASWNALCHDEPTTLRTPALAAISFDLTTACVAYAPPRPMHLPHLRRETFRPLSQLPVVGSPSPIESSAVGPIARVAVAPRVVEAGSLHSLLAAVTTATTRSHCATSQTTATQRLESHESHLQRAPPTAPSPQHHTWGPVSSLGAPTKGAFPLTHLIRAAVTSSSPPELVNLLPNEPTRNETHDTHEQPYRTSLQLRQQQAADFYRTQHNHSRASSSSGTSLRRTPNFERARSADPQQPRFVHFAENPQSAPGHRARSLTRNPELLEPHPALRISRRTASAIRFVLEEAIRVPYSFTPDLVEENSPMSDLTGGRAANGGARTTGGPVPVTQADRSNIRTPQMIMTARRQRQEAEEQRKAEEERRRSAERRTQAAGVAGITTTEPLRQSQSSAPRTGEQYVQYPSSGAARLPERLAPQSSQPQDATAGASHTRSRTNSSTQQQPRPQQANQSATMPSAESRRPPPVQHARRPSGASAPSQAGPSTAAPRPPPAPASSTDQPRDSTSSSFPHAFERWETLSSHWEGLTSYWIRRLEQNTDEVRREPLAQQMSRQITDLSAAGANLFHAVVELQRLRASSERKFQRWFYEHRQDQERAQEREAELVKSLEREREGRMDAEANMERMATEKKNAERAVAEMKRELQISKEEARRAWEELGRREQEERDRTFSLREGQPTLVGGVQVVPRVQSTGRGGEDVYADAQSGGIEQHYSYEEGQSPTDTDPFTESARPVHREPEAPSLAQGTYVPAGAASASSARPSGYSTAAEQSHLPVPVHPQYRTTQAQQAPSQPTSSRPEAFYQQPGTYLHQEQEGGIPEDERSYVTSHGETSEGEEEEYALDENGRVMLDESGRRIPFRSIRSPVSDEYDVQEDRRRELEHLQRYGTTATSSGGYATSSSAGPPHGAGYATAGQPDYSGDGYGDEWVGMRHHHPTRLSDVPEEDERSRTSPSRASQASRGRLY